MSAPSSGGRLFRGAHAPPRAPCGASPQGFQEQKFVMARAPSPAREARALPGYQRRNCRSSLWFLFAEFLEPRIVPERIEHWIEPEERGSERRVGSQWAIIRYRE